MIKKTLIVALYRFSKQLSFFGHISDYSALKSSFGSFQIETNLITLIYAEKLKSLCLTSLLSITVQMFWIIFGLKLFLSQETDEQLGNCAFFVLKYSKCLKMLRVRCCIRGSIA